jgi:hypothetical protein
LGDLVVYIKIVLKKRYEDAGWVDSILVNTIMNLFFSIKIGKGHNLLSNYAAQETLFSMELVRFIGYQPVKDITLVIISITD